MKHSDSHLILLAAGRGERLKQQMPKSLVKIDGKTILLRAFERLWKTKLFTKCIVTYPSAVNEAEGYYKELFEKEFVSHLPSEEIVFIEGGKTRQESVWNAVRYLSGLGITDSEQIVIHDSARCFVSGDIVKRVVQALSESTHAIGVTCGIPVKDTIKAVNKETMEVAHTLDRDALWQVQTPQAFPFELLFKAHRNAIENGIIGTDDASLVEKIASVSIVLGSEDNIKVTSPQDLSRP